MKFRVGFFVGAVAGAWIANKAAEQLRRSSGSTAGPATMPAAAAEEAAQRLRAFGNLARERVSELIDSPVGNAARDRLAEVLGTSLSSGRHSGTGERDGSIDASGRW